MEKKQHPSYGMIRFARSSIGGSGTALFGSSIMHNNVIRLSISKGMMDIRESLPIRLKKTGYPVKRSAFTIRL